MLFITVSLNRKVSCSTMPICRRRLARVTSRTSMAVDPHRAAHHIVEARDQVDDGGLAGAGGADDRDRLARLGDEADAAQHVLFLLVGGVDVIELHLADDGGHRLARRLCPGWQACVSSRPKMRSAPATALCRLAHSTEICWIGC